MKSTKPQNMISERDLLRAKVQSGTEFFTRYFFKKQFKKKFIIGSHHVKIWEALDRVLTGKCKRLIINMPPRYGKTEVAVKSFIAAGFAYNPTSKFIHLSYSDDLVRDNSQQINNLCNSEEYLELFPNCKPITPNSKKWYNTAGGGMYAVSSSGQVTGFGAGQVDEDEEDLDEWFVQNGETKFCGAIVIDDPIKPDDARSDLIREKVNNKFETTIRSRTNSRNTPIIIIMQRLDENDLCGYLMELEGIAADGGEWEVLNMPALGVNAAGELEALWPWKHTVEELEILRDKDSFVFDTQYNQDPKPLEGLMYERFKTYETIPFSRKLVKKGYIDTADEGKDYLCAIFYDETPIGCYVTDVLYTQKGMEFTEPTTAEMAMRNKTQKLKIESNNGGRGFARQVESQMREMGEYKCAVKWFHQSENKKVRIFNHSAEVQNMVIFPHDWAKRWPLYYKHMTKYKKEGGNAHDDAPDATTGIVENIGKNSNASSLVGVV